MSFSHDDDPTKITQDGPIWEALCKEFDLLVGARHAVERETADGDLGAQWRRKDNKAWMEYRVWEDKHFPIDPVFPLKDPKGLAEARRAFEKQQIREREQFFKKARADGRQG